MEFIPERYLGENPEKDPLPIAFGSGRRVCPGINMAYSSVFIEIAMTLSVFNISKYLDENGNTVEPEIHYSDGTVSHPWPRLASTLERVKLMSQFIRWIVGSSH